MIKVHVTEMYVFGHQITECFINKKIVIDMLNFFAKNFKTQEEAIDFIKYIFKNGRVIYTHFIEGVEKQHSGIINCSNELCNQDIFFIMTEQSGEFEVNYLKFDNVTCGV